MTIFGWAFLSIFVFSLILIKISCIPATSFVDSEIPVRLSVTESAPAFATCKIPANTVPAPGTVEGAKEGRVVPQRATT